jgi:hypothetical protein
MAQEAKMSKIEKKDKDLIVCQISNFFHGVKFQAVGRADSGREARRLAMSTLFELVEESGEVEASEPIEREVVTYHYNGTPICTHQWTSWNQSEDVLTRYYATKDVFPMPFDYVGLEFNNARISFA